MYKKAHPQTGCFCVRLKLLSATEREITQGGVIRIMFFKTPLRRRVHLQEPKCLRNRYAGQAMKVSWLSKIRNVKPEPRLTLHKISTGSIK